MIFDRVELARQALEEALAVRRKAAIKLWEPLCVYDLAATLGVKTRFVAIPSMEGMYCANRGPVIMVNSERPAGRQAFTCAHEIGHHVFGHGDRIDSMALDGSPGLQKDPDEFLADCFAGFLLMPKVAVSNAFHRRQWNPATATPVQLFTIAGMLGVGYEALIRHMQISLKMLTKTQADRLASASPKSVRQELLGRPHTGGLVVADLSWIGRPIDMEVGDLILAPARAQYKGACLGPIQNGNDAKVFEALAAGSAQIESEAKDWATFVRVSRKSYQGLATFRHLPEESNE